MARDRDRIPRTGTGSHGPGPMPGGPGPMAGTERSKRKKIAHQKSLVGYCYVNFMAMAINAKTAKKTIPIMTQ